MDFDTQAGLIYSTLSDNEKRHDSIYQNHKSDVVDMPINELAEGSAFVKEFCITFGIEARLYRLFRIKVFFKRRI